MNQLASRWKILILPLLALSASLLAGGLLVYGTHVKLAKAHRELAHQQSLLQLANQRFAKADEEKKAILQYLNDYQVLQQEGFVGDEQRLAWVDALRETNDSLKLFGVEYQISQQGPSPIRLDTGNFQLQQSAMKLNFDLLQEEDLIHFFNQLSQYKAGLFMVNGCTVERRATTGFTARFEPKLHAECELNWFSLKEMQPPGQP